MGKRVVVLGGAGLIGTHLCLRLLTEGNQVFCVDVRDAADSPRLNEVRQMERFKFVRHNITENFSIHCDQIYNLTAPLPLRSDRMLPVETLRVNVLGAINALEVARSERARVLYASSGNIAEQSYLANEQTRNSYRYILSEGKRAGEAFHRAYSNEYGVDTRIARIFNTYGTGADINDQRVVMKMIVAALHNRDIVINGNGEQRRTFCWVGDMVEGLIRFMGEETIKQVETLALGSNEEVSIRTLAEMIIAITASRSRIIHTTHRNNDPLRSAPNLIATEQKIGWIPRTPLKEGLQRVADYVQRELSHTAWSKMSWIETNY